MELVILIGIQASGKSSFFKHRFADSHVRLNLDMLRTRHRESVLFEACLAAKANMVVDNTNPTAQDRARYIEPAKAARFRVVGYWFATSTDEALARNAKRTGTARIPDVGVRATAARFEAPELNEGFDELHRVTCLDDIGSFHLEAIV